MVKKILVSLISLLVFISCVFLYWPLSLSDVIAENEELYIQHGGWQFTERGTLGDIKYTQVELQPNTEQFDVIVQILSSYTYHRSLRTFFGDSSISGKGDSLYIRSGANTISNLGSGEILINGTVYRLGYWKDKKAQEMIDEITVLILE